MKCVHVCEEKTHMTRQGVKNHETVGVLSRSAAGLDSKRCLYDVERLFF